MGVLAVRLQVLNKELKWDGNNMKFTNITDNDKITVASSEMKVVDGHPTLVKGDKAISAVEYAGELIKHSYRDGWSLPAMP
jgi:hypothetical protein